jgi:hypothetical protein
MTDDRRTGLRGRYLSLGFGELFAAVVFIGVAFVSVLPLLERPSDALAFWSALIPLLVILVQAGVYWLLARRSSCWPGSSASSSGSPPTPSRRSASRSSGCWASSST